METTKIEMDMQSDDAALIRLLGVVRRRGYAVRKIEATETDAGAMRVCMAIASERPIENLIKQIARIIGVGAISVDTPAPAINIAPATQKAAKTAVA